MNRKIISFTLILLIIGSLFVGCQDKTAEAINDESKINPIGEYPIVNDKITLTAFAGTTIACDNFEENDFTKWMEEKTNIHLDWTVALQQDRVQKLNLLMASGSYPGIIFDSFFTVSQQYVYGKQGMLKPLNELIDKYAPNTKKVLNDYKRIKSDFTMPDGNIYSIPRIAECYHCQVPAKMWINTEWLDNLGLEMPTTTDEFYNVLKAFKEQDPNNNQIQDEIPLSGAQKGWLSSPEYFIMNAFIYSNYVQHYLQVKDNKIVPVYTQEEWKEGLKYMNKLFEEGLLDPQSYTQNAEQLKKLGENPGDCILGVAPGGSTTSFVNVGTSDRYESYKTVPALQGPNGERNALYNPTRGTANFNITDKCENPVAAIRWADACFEDEVRMRNITGRPGKEWEYAKEGDIGMDGTQAEWVSLIAQNSDQQKGHAWGQVGPYFANVNTWLKRKSSDTIDMEKILYDESKENYMPYIPNIEKVLPVLCFNEENSRIITDIQTQIDNYLAEKMVKFISGEEDIDKNWDKYIAEFDNMNIDQYLQIYQDAYDAKQELTENQ